jgi:(p)ppGpp synthase/HD superfamily hydrolase
MSQEICFKALQIVEKAFLDKKDKGGHPYINHLIDVHDKIFKVYPWEFELRAVSLLHDLLEDCPEWTEDKLREEFNDNIVDSVVALTKVRGEKYDDYISRLMKNTMAKIVKLADLESNMDITRLNDLTEKDFERLKKYQKTYKKLKKAVDGRF